jgi:hypothetical protein
MKEIEIIAKTKGQPDLKGKAKQYDSLAEAEKDLTKEIALAILNAQVKTNAMNKLRKPATGALSLGKLIASAKASGKLTKDAQDKLADILKKAGVTIPDGVL